PCWGRWPRPSERDSSRSRKPFDGSKESAYGGRMSILLAVTLLFAAGGESELRAGFGSADLTPEAGVSIPGGFKPNPATGVRDPLYAVACVVTDGKTPIALVGIDELFITKPTVRQARERIEKNTKIPAANILIAASHTHTGGPIASCLGNES